MRVFHAMIQRNAGNRSKTPRKIAEMEQPITSVSSTMRTNGFMTFSRKGEHPHTHRRDG